MRNALQADNPSTIRVVIVLEAATVTGPAKNLMRFCRGASEPHAGLPAIQASLVTYLRADYSQASNPFIDAAHKYGIPIDVITERGRWDRSVIVSLDTILRKRQAHILQTHAVKSNFLVRFGSLHKHFPWIAFHHGYTAENLKARAYNQLNRWSLPAARQVVTVCRPFAQQIQRYGIDPSRLHVLPNAIEEFSAPDPAAVEALRVSLGVGHDEAILFTAGRFSLEKAHRDLVEAVALVRRDHPGLCFRLLMVGDGPERASVQSMVQQLGLSSICLFPGHLLDLRPYFALATHFVLPSWTEGSPNVILEAMAARLPIVATQVGGVPETVIDGESALLCPPRNPAALASVIATVLSDSVLASRLATAAHARMPLFSPETYRRNLIGIYQRALAPRF